MPFVDRSTEILFLFDSYDGSVVFCATEMRNGQNRRLSQVSSSVLRSQDIVNARPLCAEDPPAEKRGRSSTSSLLIHLKSVQRFFFFSSQISSIDKMSWSDTTLTIMSDVGLNRRVERQSIPVCSSIIVSRSDSKSTPLTQSGGTSRAWSW